MDKAMDYAALVQRTSPDAVLVIAPDGKVVHWDAGAEVQFGYSAQEAVGRSLVDLIVPPDQAQQELLDLAQVAQDSVSTFEALRCRKDGSRLYVCVSNKRIRDPQTGESLVLCTKKDVTQLRLRRDAQNIEAQFRDLLESVPDGIVIVSPSGHVVYANTHAQRMFGYEPGDLPGRTIEILLPHRFHASHLGHRTGYFGQPRTRPMGIGLELFGLRKDGSEFPVEISLSPLSIENTTLAMSAIRDATSRQRIEQELRDKNVALENANRAKDRFLASMSHELRTPLNSVIGFTGTLLMRLAGPLNDEQEKQLRTVQTSARHLLSLINDLLDLAKIEADQLRLTLSEVDCVAVAREVAESLKLQAAQKGLEFQVQVPDGPCVLQADRRALSQIVINLLANAIKFTDKGSVILRVVRPMAGARRGVEISVTDTGPGIQREDLPHLFDAFARFGTPEQHAKGGSGLGLHLSRKLATLMHGEIVCDSVPGRGSTFRLQLPA